jgi:F-type H+-transporting ATPase subunit a
MIQALGIKNNGLVGYLKGLVPPGIPLFVLPIMIIVEFLGLLTKPFALCIRLFANMTAGHVVILALIGLIFSLGYGATPVSIGFALFIYLLEILVALLQAYIFTMLSALFIGMAVHQEH